jgi:dTDP-4-dehydrorhamnose reductase
MKKILLIGSTGLVGSRVKELLSSKFKFITPDENELNLLDPKGLTSFINKHKPDSIINFAAYTNVGEAENQTGDKQGLCWQLNVVGVNNLLKSINKTTQFIHISTDMVFSGDKKDPGPYKENSPLPNSPDKLTWYGWTKNRGEELVRKAGHNVVRIIYPVRANFERPDYLRFPLRKLREGNLYPLFADQQLTITYIDELAQALSVVINKNLTNDTFHICSSNTGTSMDIIKTAFNKLNIDTQQIKSALLTEYLSKQKNPYRYLVFGGLDTKETEKELGLKFSTWQEIIDKLIKQGLTLKNA